MKTIFLYLIKFYQQAISPHIGHRCRFHPSCSVYGYESITRFGAIKGGYLTARRLGKCGPWHPGGVDLVPETWADRKKKQEYTPGE